MNKVLTLITAVLAVSILFVTCKNQEQPTPENVDQPISVSITVDGATSAEAGVR